MSSKTRKNLYWLTPIWLLIIVLALYVLFQIPMRAKAGQPNVLFITMDSLRHDHLGCTGYQRAHTPNIDALARDGAVFMQAVAQGTYTRISVPSIVTGKFALLTGVKLLQGYLDSTHTTMAEVLSADEYFTCSTTRIWSDSFYQGFDTTGTSHATTEQRTEQTIRALEQHEDEKLFIWLYYWDPHAPYKPPDEFMRLYEPDYTEISLKELMAKAKDEATRLRDHTGHYNGSIATLLEAGSGKIKLTAMDREHLLNLYDAEIAYVDSEIGKVVAKLKKMGLYDNTLIVLNADHGEAFGEHQRYYHGMTVYDEEARVPLIIKPPYSRNKNKVVQDQVRNIDILPTVLDYCGLKTPEDCNGQTLRPLIETDSSPDLPSITETYAGKHPTRRLLMAALRHQGHKLIYDLGEERVLLYDLRVDPREKKNLLPEAATIEPIPGEAQDPARQKEQQMRAELLDLLRLQRISDLASAEENLEEIDEKTREQLKALGYIY